LSDNLSDLIDEVVAMSETDTSDASETLEESDSGVEFEETPEEEVAEEAPAAPTALDEAYQKALAEVQQSGQALHASRVMAELEAKRPTLIAFETLDEQNQAWVLDESQRAGVDPQTVLYSIYQQQVAEYNRERNSMQGSFERAKAQAQNTVASFIATNEYVAKLPDAERKAFIEGIGQLESVQAIEELAHVNPMKWAKAVTAIAGKEIAGLAAREAGKASAAGAKSAMKSSMGTNKSAATKVQTTPQDPLSALLAGPTPSWEKRLKQTK
jgi:hypothetical protein